MIKTLLLLTFLALTSFTSFVQAKDSFNLPNNHFTLDKMTEAKAAAAAEKKGVAFIYSNKNSTCPLCNEASDEFVSAVKARTVIVYVDTPNLSKFQKEIKTVCPALWTALTAGKFIPRVAVTDAEMKTVVSSLDYSSYKADKSKSIRTLRKELAEQLKK